MSTDYDDDDTESHDDERETPASLRAAAKAGKDAQSEAARLRRENLFLRAGIDPEGNRASQLLFKTFEGNDVEALKAEAQELGIKLPGASPEETQQGQAEQQQADVRNTLNGSRSTPAGAGESIDPDPISEAFRIFHKQVAGGRPREEAALQAIDGVFAAAAAGDSRVLFNAEEWYANAVAADPRR